jgi:hypothetical protein
MGKKGMTGGAHLSARQKKGIYIGGAVNIIIKNDKIWPNICHVGLTSGPKQSEKLVNMAKLENQCFPSQTCPKNGS